MRVLVTQRVDYYPDRNETRDALDQDLIRWLLGAGFMPIPVPNALAADDSDSSTLSEWVSNLSAAGIILSGGNDLGQSPERDLCETFLLNMAAEKSIPVLGICRGMQMMAVWGKGKLKPMKGHVRTRHRLNGDISTEVNSYHTMTLTDCPSDFKVIATSEDGEIEAIQHNILPWEGWMWHPEREPVFTRSDTNRLKLLFNCTN